MSRISMLVAIAVASGVVGCAQCDTCDDFPAPCTGPNCGHDHGGMPGYQDPGMPQSPAVMGSSTPNTPMGGDAAGPAPTTPSGPPSTPDPATPPVPTEPAPK